MSVGCAFGSYVEGAFQWCGHADIAMCNFDRGVQCSIEAVPPSARSDGNSMDSQKMMSESIFEMERN